MAEIAVHGLAELNAQLKTLPAKVEANILRGAVRAGQKVVLEKAQAMVPAKSGNLRRSIRVKTDFKAARRGFVRADVVAGGKMAWYAHILEFGSGSFYEGSGYQSVRKPYVIKAKDEKGKRYNAKEKRRINRGSREGALFWQGQMASRVVHPGIRPQPYMRPAAELLEGPALDAFVAYVQKRLPKELEKVGRAP